MMTELRFNANELRADHMETVIEWVRTLGVEAKDVKADVAILRGENSWELHLSRFVRDEQGRMVIDQARNEPVTYPLIVDLGAERSWPACLAALEIRDGVVA